ncbi:hypothetical protein HJC23_007511 [Cyclotella cryptica]|uniref:Alpha/beta hydrolase fold-3 domain-containing protein n=1 Tax=Cyclotella cryptica TaxID=29204 RepID=A0ABD3PVW0_9STRA
MLQEHSNGSHALRRRSYHLIELNDATSVQLRAQNFRLLITNTALRCVERLIHTHLLDLLDREMEFLSLFGGNDSQKYQFFGEHKEFPSLMDTVETLASVEKAARKYKRDHDAVIKSPIRSFSHQRMCSEPARFFTGDVFLSIDDPVEAEDGTDGWYFGGQQSQSPPSIQRTSKDSMLKNGIITVKPSDGSRHRRTFSTGAVDSPIRARESAAGNSVYPSRSAKDSSLFRLIVTLQLCLVRIDEANAVMCKGQAQSIVGSRDRFNSDLDLLRTSTGTNSFDSDSSSPGLTLSDAKSLYSKSWTKSVFVVALGLGVACYCSTNAKTRTTTTSERVQVLKSGGKVTSGLVAMAFIRRRWRTLCTNARVSDSAEAIRHWIFQWICLVNENSVVNTDHQLFMPEKHNSWYSIGSLRFQLIKRGMDLFYASIGKAIEITRDSQENQETPLENKSSGLWTYVVASLAASYYNVIGPAAKSAQVVSSSSNSVIKNAWGVVSLPAVKSASLEATRILKGASIADRIEIDGISCFVLSREPFPALASALRRYRRQLKREDARLGTIHEQVSFGHASVNVSGFVRRNVIFHLTGGGFFAHTIAGDLPYLLDWSAATDSVVIIPEYALLPKHKFPDAIAQITQIYRALRCGQAATLLGFQANKIIVSGESAGGNLTAALCVTIIMDRDESQYVQLTPSRSMELVTDQDESLEEDEDGRRVSADDGTVPLPDALLMSCPALNLSLESSPSRIAGAQDPVLPSGLIAVISNSYLPVEGNFPKTHPIASPYFASDETLSQFPPTLTFSSSEDPFLDDSVNFNARLRSVGVKSHLRAVHHMPHAFWALSTAGIPEARQVQQECIEWISRMFRNR